MREMKHGRRETSIVKRRSSTSKNKNGSDPIETRQQKEEKKQKNPQKKSEKQTKRAAEKARVDSSPDGRTDRRARFLFLKIPESGSDELLRLRPGVFAQASLRPVARLIRHYNLALSKP